MPGLTHDPFLWYANRGTGVVLVALLTLSTALGVISTARAGYAAGPGSPPRRCTATSRC